MGHLFVFVKFGYIKYIVIQIPVSLVGYSS